MFVGRARAPTLLFVCDTSYVRDMPIMQPGDTPEKRLLSGGFAFAEAAILLFEANPVTTPWATCFVNLGFGFELGLKAFIRARGGTVGEQRRLGHDLQALLRRAEELGFSPSHPGIAAYVADLSPTHMDMSTRYLEGESAELPAIEGTYAAVRQLLKDVADQG